jgi:molecular chaperone IbpA
MPKSGLRYVTCLIKEKTKTKITSFDLTPFYRNSIGVDRLFDRIISQIDTAAGSSSNNYPPYNIIKHGDDTFEVQVAVAGFTEGEVEIAVKDGTLVITGEHQPEAQLVGTEYLHQGISARKFIRTFQLAEYVEVIEASSNNGILSVRLERKVPEAMKPKTIAITYKK